MGCLSSPALVCHTQCLSYLVACWEEFDNNNISMGQDNMDDKIMGQVLLKMCIIIKIATTKNMSTTLCKK